MKKFLILLVATLVSFVMLGSATVMAQDAPTIPQPEGELYGIGSVSKVFTAAAVMKLVEQGKLELDTPIVHYLPEFQMADSRYRQITPRMLLNHSAGLMGMTDNNAFLLGDNDTYNHDHFLVFLQEQTLKHNPGEMSIYSNDSFTLAEILVERVSGVSFTQFLEENLVNPLGLTNMKTPQSNFDRNKLAAIYSGSNQLRPEHLGVIGSGGLYASMEDLCRLATIFMDGADGSVLSKQSAEEMAKNQQKNLVVAPDADTTILYGLGWDCVDTYPFNQLGIQALSKGGGTGAYHTNLTVLPQHNLAVAVSSSGQDAYEQLIAQEIILEVLREEGLIEEVTLELPQLDTTPATVPEAIKDEAGLYDGGQGYLLQVEFTDDTLQITPIGVRNERPQIYQYNTDGQFVSTGGDYITRGGLVSAQDGTRGVSCLSFAEGKYLLTQSYESKPGLSQTANAMPIAEKIAPNPVPEQMKQAWMQRNGKEYLLISEKYTSFKYMSEGLARLHTDERAPGYVGMGNYQGGGKQIKSAKIVDDNLAVGFQSTPTMIGRDTNNIRLDTQNGIEILHINNYRYIDSNAAAKASALGEHLVITDSTVWFDVDQNAARQIWQVQTPEDGAWFVYDEKMNCVASSLEQSPRAFVTLPEKGRIAFAGEAGAEFLIHKEGMVNTDTK